MKEVQAIRDPQLLQYISEDLKSMNNRNYMIFMCGLYTGRRITDILSMKVSDIRNKDHIKDHVYVKESKTGKSIYLPICTELKKALTEYTKDMELHEYLFRSPHKILRPLHRTTFYKILNDVTKKYGLVNIGCHTMRKTFGYHHYKKWEDGMLLMDIFGHTNVSVTLRYIGMTQKSIDDSMKNFKIF